MFGGSITIVGMMMMAVAVLLSNCLHLHCRCNSCVWWQYHYRRYDDDGGGGVVVSLLHTTVLAGKETQTDRTKLAGRASTRSTIILTLGAYQMSCVMRKHVF